ncbi:MAG: ABC transporter ATP-binding protein [Firmicutes bacterium]|nr:ABC transporter ATP-binding protein [Bacillota bacterium]
MVEIQNLKVVYSGNGAAVTALDGVSLTLGEGKTCAVIGPSGCGKSSLLYAVAGLIRPAAGRVLIHNKPVTPKRKETALILQDYGLLPWKTAWQNVALGLELRGIAREKVNSLVEEAMRELGLWNFRHHYPAQLSGGQRQRVAIARSLTLKPDLFLLDEPFSSLDALTRENLQESLLDFWRKTRTSIMLVTHNIEEAVFLGQKIAIFSPGPGRIIHVVENDEMGNLAYRKSDSFYARCTLVRDLLSKGSKG